MAGSGLAHYVKADELLAEIEASPAISNETETSLATGPSLTRFLLRRRPSR